MTYTYKLARRLAISRNLAMVNVLVLFAACAGETTAPEAPASPTTPAAPHAPLGFRVLPGNVTIETDQRIRFRGEMRTRRGQVSAPSLAWEASGGSIDSLGNFFADKPGTYRVVGRGGGRGRERLQRPDTSIVVVVRQQPGLVGITVTPRASRLSVNQTLTFTAVGRLANGTDAAIGVNWTATGGTIDPAGVYQAGSTAGKFVVIATNTSGTVADTVTVRISVPETPDTIPDPTPDPTPALARVVLRPATVFLATAATQQFAAFGRNTAGDSVVVDVTFRATGGTITPTGLYTAGQTAGTYQVIATSSELADTTVVTLAQSSGGSTPGTGTGIPFGPFAILNATTGVTPFTMAIQGVTASSILSRLNEARTAKIKLMLNTTGGSHENYLTNGVFDRAKWDAKMDAYNTPAIRQAVAEAVADGTIVGHSVMDEPNVHGGGDGNTWGPQGTMTKARIDSMCGYAKAIFPTLPVGVLHRHDIFEPTKSYRVCDFLISQFANRIGSVTEFRDAGLALARRDGHAIMFSLNILDGGVQDRTGAWDCPGSGIGTFAPNCRMTASQVREYGLTLGPAGCGLVMWKYDARFMANTENEQAFRDVAARLASVPAPPCRRR